MKTASLRFGENTLENIRTLGDGKLLKLSLAKGKLLARHRTKEALTIAVLDGEIQFESGGQTLKLERMDSVLLDPAEEHAVEALEDSVLLLVLLPSAAEMQGRSSAYMEGDWRDKLVPEFRNLAEDHERVLAALEQLERFDLASFDEAITVVANEVLEHVAAEEELLFPKLAPYLGGVDVGPIPKLRHEHAEIRGLYERCLALRKEVDENEGKVHELFDTVAQLVEKLSGHIEKEDLHLFPMAGRLMSDEDKAAFREEWQFRTEHLVSHTRAR